MASKRFEKGSPEWQLFQSFWKLCQCYWIPENNDKYWDELIAITDEFYKKYKDVDKEFAANLVRALVDTLGCKNKEKE